MKKISIIFCLLYSITIDAQTNKAIPVKCTPCAPGNFTSIGQLKDVKPADKFYPDLKSLIEKYSIDIAPCTGEIFGGKQILTNMNFVQMLNTALDRMLEVIEEVSYKMSDEKRDEFSKKIFPQSYDRYKHFFTSIAQIKDLNESDCIFMHAQSLIERYGIDFTNQQGLLEANKPANAKNISLLLKSVFNLNKFDPAKYAKPTISKGDFAIMFNSVLGEYSNMITKALD